MAERAIPVTVDQFLHEILRICDFGETIANNSSAYLNQLKIQSYTENKFFQ